MKQNFKIFENSVFGKLRTCLVDNNVMFAGRDVAKALGYKNTQKAIRDHVDEEDKTVNESFAVNGTPLLLINESGLYSLVLSSKLEQAKAFKRWVTSEVLPQIRQTGGYIPMKNHQTGELLSQEEILRRAAEITKRTIELQNCCNKDCLTATEVAASWGMDVKSFNNLLESMDIQYWEGRRWHLNKQFEGRGLTEDRYFFCFSLKGNPCVRDYMVWTPEGVDFLNLAVRKLPREISVNAQLEINLLP